MIDEIMSREPEQPKDLIRITYQNDQPAVLARELHEFLGVETPYHKWFPRMCEYGFTENEDFVVMDIFVHNSAGGPQTKKDAAISIDMAKEICMLQRNEKGKIARQYFIQLEKDWNSPEKVMARALLIANKKINSLEAKIKADAPAVAFANNISLSKDSITIEKFAKSLFDLHGIRIGRNRLYRLLRETKVLKADNLPYQKYLESGWFQVRQVQRNGSLYNQTLICGKGQQKIYELIKAMYFNGKALEQGNELLAAE